MSDLSSFLIPRGFRFAAASRLKASGRPDFALIVADAPASAAAAFTANRVIAAPLIIDKEHLSATGGRVRVVAINAGNANCAAGKQASKRASDVRCGRRAFDCRAEEVFLSSTGIIGVRCGGEADCGVARGCASLGNEAAHFLAAHRRS